MTRRTNPAKATGVLLTRAAQHGHTSNRYERVTEFEILRDQRAQDTGRRRAFYRNVVIAVNAILVWPRDLCVGSNVPIGRVAYMAGRKTRKLNLKFEEQFMSGKTDRLWAWRLRYREERDKVMSNVVDRIVFHEDDGITTAVKRTLDLMGLPYEDIEP